MEKKDWNYEQPELRAKVANLQAENEILRNDIKSLTEAYYGLLNRIKELTENKNA